MRVYVQFYDKKLNGEVGESLGTDGVYELDKRKNLPNHIESAIQRANNLEKVQPHYIAFKIMKGERYSSAKPITDLIAIRIPNSVDFILKEGTNGHQSKTGNF